MNSTPVEITHEPPGIAIGQCVPLTFDSPHPLKRESNWLSEAIVTRRKLTTLLVSSCKVSAIARVAYKYERKVGGDQTIPRYLH